MRVEVKIPGSVESYCTDERGEKRVASDSLWLETFLCGVLRAYSYADDGSGDVIKKIIGIRRFNPITSTDLEHKFLDAAEKLFFKGMLLRLYENQLTNTIVSGWQLGSDPEIQVPNLVSNHLTTGLLSYIKTTGRYASGENLFEKLRTRDPEVSSLLARVLLAGDEEVRAVRLLKEAIEELPMDYSLLDCQASFLQKKGNLNWALPLAKRAVIAAPSEFSTWSRLAEVYVGLEQWDLALLTLNSCPMFTYQDKDAPRMPEPAKVSLPVLPETKLDEIDDGADGYDHELVHPNLRKLSAATYKGTFLKAYSLLTEITSKIGWDQLLRIRSQVFVMEEEYRSEKSQPGTGRTTGKFTGNNASTTALHAPSPKTNGEGSLANSPAVQPEEDAATLHENKDEAEATDNNDQDDMEKPEPTVTSAEVKSGGEDHDPSHNDYTHFQNKRLCERWLDNLFMVLYEDLRIYTIWRTDMARAKATTGEASSPNPANNPQYSKSAEEWEILGDLADRLHHGDEALEAYQNCLRIRFSPKAMKAVVKMWEEDRKNENVLNGMIRLITWQYRWYSEVSDRMIYCLQLLIRE
jgi:tetratricopeptide (TPR) repeat protein